MRNVLHVHLRLAATIVLAVVSLSVRQQPSTATLTVQVSNICQDSHYFSQDLIIICTSDGFHKATNDGWKQIHPTENYWQSVSPDGAIYLYDADTGDIQRSLDGGETWGQSGVYTETLGGQNTLSASPISSTVFIVDNPWRGIHKSTDFGATWRRVYFEPGVFKTRIMFSPSFAEDGIAFVDLKSETGTDGVWRTEDWGETWNHIDSQWLPSTARTEYALAISPQFDQDQTAFALSGSGFYKSVDGGKTWSRLWHGLSLKAIGVSPNYISDQTLLVGDVDYQGLYLSQDGGQSWEPVDFPDYPRHISIRLMGTFQPWPLSPPQEAIGPYRVYLPSVHTSRSEQLEFWIITNGMYGDPNHYLYCSRDLGMTWEKVSVFEASHDLFLPIITHASASNQ